jgi:Tfp pilus assembly protein FimT
VELLTVVGIITLMAGISIPAVTTLSQANQISSAARVVSNLMSLARSEAVTKGTQTRFVVITGWSQKQEAEYRRFSVWRYDQGNGTWLQATKWEEMPQGIAFDPSSASYANAANPATDHLFNGTEASDSGFEPKINGQAVKTRYVEFAPNGSASVPNMSGLEIWMALAKDVESPVGSSASPTNWAKITTSALTGRLKIIRP